MKAVIEEGRLIDALMTVNASLHQQNQLLERQLEKATQPPEHKPIDLLNENARLETENTSLREARDEAVEAMVNLQKRLNDAVKERNEAELHNAAQDADSRPLSGTNEMTSVDAHLLQQNANLAEQVAELTESNTRKRKRIVTLKHERDTAREKVEEIQSRWDDTPGMSPMTETAYAKRVGRLETDLRNAKISRDKALADSTQYVATIAELKAEVKRLQTTLDAVRCERNDAVDEADAYKRQYVQAESERAASQLELGRAKQVLEKEAYITHFDGTGATCNYTICEPSPRERIEKLEKRRDELLESNTKLADIVSLIGRLMNRATGEVLAPDVLPERVEICLQERNEAKAEVERLEHLAKAVHVNTRHDTPPRQAEDWVHD